MACSRSFGVHSCFSIARRRLVSPAALPATSSATRFRLLLYKPEPDRQFIWPALWQFPPFAARTKGDARETGRLYGAGINSPRSPDAATSPGPMSASTRWRQRWSASAAMPARRLEQFDGATADQHSVGDRPRHRHRLRAHGSQAGNVADARLPPQNRTLRKPPGRR